MNIIHQMAKGMAITALLGMVYLSFSGDLFPKMDISARVDLFADISIAFVISAVVAMATNKY